MSPKPSVPRDGEIYRNAGVGFEFGDSQSSDGIVVERGMSMGEGEGGKVKRVGMSKYWDASQSQGEGEAEGEGDVEGDVEGEDEGDVEAEGEGDVEGEGEDEDEGDVEAEGEDEGDVEGEDEGEEDEKCGPRPSWWVWRTRHGSAESEKNCEVLGERKHHVCVCDIFEGNSRRCYNDMFGDELSMGDEWDVFKSDMECKRYYQARRLKKKDRPPPPSERALVSAPGPGGARPAGPRARRPGARKKRPKVTETVRGSRL